MHPNGISVSGFFAFLNSSLRVSMERQWGHQREIPLLLKVLSHLGLLQTWDFWPPLAGAGGFDAAFFPCAFTVSWKRLAIGLWKEMVCFISGIFSSIADFCLMGAPWSESSWDPDCPSPSQAEGCSSL